MLLFIKIPIKHGTNLNIYSIILLRRNNILLAYIQLHSSVYGRYLNSSKNRYNTSVYITVVHVGIILFQMLLNILAQVTHTSNIVCAEELNTEGLLPQHFLINFLHKIPVSRAHEYKIIFILDISILTKLQFTHWTDSQVSCNIFVPTYFN